VGLERDRRAAEAALKTYLVGALFGILLLLGVTIVHAVTGTTSYSELAARAAAAPHVAVGAGAALVLAGLMFKAGAVPAHFWVPDAAQGSAGFAAAFATTVPKVGAVVAAYRLVTVLADIPSLGLLVGVVAVASMTLGNLAAYAQQDPRRLLGWSTVSQVGYLLVPVAVAGHSDLALPSVLLYLAGYAVTNLAAFAVTTSLPSLRTLEGYAGLVRAHPSLAGALLVALLGLLGTPPTVVFVGKLTTATSAWDGGDPWLTAAVLVNTVASLYYYLRWFGPALRHTRTGGPLPPAAAATAAARPWSAWTARVTATLSVLMGVLAGPLWQLVDSTLVR
jgi:NADH-quinone oxidoreductase subunit N